MGEALIIQKNTITNEEMFATINVTYPSGSTCTCTNGDRVLTDTNTNGTVIFAIPYAGTWIVSCTDGTNSSSQSVSITTEGQSESVELNYRFYILKDGVSDETFVKSGKGTAGTSGSYITFKGSTAAWSPSGYYYYPTLIDVSGYSTLYFEGYASRPDCNEDGQYPICQFYAGDASKEISSSEEVQSLDISSIDGECEIGLYTMSRHSSLEGNSKRGTIYAKNIWLE